MKKSLSILCALCACCMMFLSCSNDDGGNEGRQTTANYVTVPNADYQEGTFPAPTTDEVLEGVSLNTTSGNTSTIKIAKNGNYVRYFIGVKNTPGYYVYTPSGTRATEEDDFFEIPISTTSSGTTLLLSAEDTQGKITSAFEFTINYTDTKNLADFRIILNNQSILACQHDNKGRITYIESRSNSRETETMTITYNGDKPNKIVMKGLENGEEYETYTFSSISTNSYGYITNMSGSVVSYDDDEKYTGTETIAFTYNSNGYLTGYKDTYKDSYGTDVTTHNLSWINNNLMSHSWSDNDGDSGTTSAEYSKIANEKQQGTLGLMYIGPGNLILSNLFGKLPTNLPASVTMENGRKNEFTYDLNGDGSIKTEYLNGTALVYSYSE